MPVFTTYNERTGDITGQLNGSERLAELNKPYVKGSWDHRQYKIVGGNPVKREDYEELQNTMEFRKLRESRNNKLSKSDWTQMPDAPLSKEDKKAWADYRKSLRDLPQKTEDPKNPNWPRRP